MRAWTRQQDVASFSFGHVARRSLALAGEGLLCSQALTGRPTGCGYGTGFQSGNSTACLVELTGIVTAPVATSAITI